MTKHYKQILGLCHSQDIPDTSRARSGNKSLSVVWKDRRRDSACQALSKESPGFAARRLEFLVPWPETMASSRAFSHLPLRVGFAAISFPYLNSEKDTLNIEV